LRVPISELKSAATAASTDAAHESVAGELAHAPGSSANAVSTLEEAERQHILRALRQTEWRIAGMHGAATLLGMKRTTLQARMRKLNIRRPI
jgi:formate hydrogenlyase transcriptional activator